jgi:hypothetical protein
MPQLNTPISTGLWRALMEDARRTQEPVTHIVNRALATYLQVPHHTLYQVSTATALVEGIYQGAVRVGTLREHGDLGLGTLENLDGEMVIVDGRFFHVRSDGSVRECGDDVLTPFAVITRFAPDAAVTMDRCPEMSDLTARFDALRNSADIFYYLPKRSISPAIDSLARADGQIGKNVADEELSRVTQLRGLKSVCDADVRERDVLSRASVLQETGEVDRNRRMQIERPAEFEVDLITNVSRAASAARPDKGTANLIQTVL